jgi:hypothetical protein
MLKSLPWIICLAFAIIIIGMIVFKKPPPPPVKDILAEQRAKEAEAKSKKLEVAYAELEKKIKADSVAYHKKDSISNRKISRLTIRLKAINTTKATSKELDSLINLLYEK